MRLANFSPMKRFLAALALLLSSFVLRAQDVSEKPDDALALWGDIIIRKDFNKWHVGGLLEYCSIDKGQGMVHNEMILRPIVGYNPLKWLRLQMQVDFLYSCFDGFFLRYLPDVSFHLKASDFSFSLRNRLQLTHHVSTGKLTPVIRTRAKVDYSIPSSPVSVHIAAEPYWLKDFVKTRYYLGADFRISDMLSITADYIRYQHYRPGTPDQNVAYLILYITL